MSAQTTNFLQDALHLELGLEALQSAVNGLSFANGNFWHGLLLVWGELKRVKGVGRIDVGLDSSTSKLIGLKVRVASKRKRPCPVVEQGRFGRPSIKG